MEVNQEVTIIYSSKHPSSPKEKKCLIKDDVYEGYIVTGKYGNTRYFLNTKEQTFSLLAPSGPVKIGDEASIDK